MTPKPTPIDVLRRRETKWLDMLSDWDGYMLKHYKKVRDKGHIAAQYIDTASGICGYII